MSLRLPIEGLDVWAREIPDGGLLVLEGAGTTVPRHVAARIAEAAAATGHRMTWASVFGKGAPSRRDEAAPNEKGHGKVRAARIQKWTDVEKHAIDGGLVVDSVSWAGVGADPAELATGLLRLRDALTKTGSISVLLLETGLLGPERDALVRHAADGILQFKSREDADGVAQFVRIPKWFEAASITLNIYFSFDGSHLLVDTRKRVV